MNQPDRFPEAVSAAKVVMDRHMAALNARDAQGLAATLHFPHYRFTGGQMKVWEKADSYLADFFARAGDGWHHSAWDFITVIAAGPDKVHLDVQFTRYRIDNSAMGSFRSFWVIAQHHGVWGAQLRSSYAA